MAIINEITCEYLRLISRGFVIKIKEISSFRSKKKRDFFVSLEEKRNFFASLEKKEISSFHSKQQIQVFIVNSDNKHLTPEILSAIPELYQYLIHC